MLLLSGETEQNINKLTKDLDEKNEKESICNQQISNLELQLDDQKLLKNKLQDLEDQMKDYSNLKEYSSNKSSEYSKLKNEHQIEIERMKIEYEKLINDKNKQMKQDYENQIRELKEKLDKDDLDKSSSSADFSKSSDLGQKLKDQVNLTKELDSRLITDSIKMNEKLLVEFNNKKNSKNNEASQLPDNIKVKILIN